MHAMSIFHKLLLCLLLLFLCASNSFAATVSGYSEYYIPGDEVSMYTIFNTLFPSATTPMHCLISVTTGSDNTTIYYDHWENGFSFDPANPAATADEIYTVATAGGVKTFESANIPTAPRGLATFYDGGDRIYIAGGAATITRAGWIEGVGVGNQAVSWEIYPVKPQLTTYVVPFGEVAGGDFDSVYVLIQATADNTTFTVDLNGNGTPDLLNSNRNATKSVADGDLTTITLNRGQTFLLDRISACTSGVTCTTAPGTMSSGIVITGSSTLQVKYVAGLIGDNYRSRGFSAFPRGLWTKDYYAPLDNPSGGRVTDYYLFNPNTTAITINWESRAGAGTPFIIPANTTVSFIAATGGAVPIDSGLYFRGSDIFWGVGLGDATQRQFEWGFSLLPSTMLYTEHFLGWAPDSNPGGPGPWAGATDMGVFLTVAQDNTRVFVDFNNDNVVDQTYTLDRLQTQYIVDPDGFLSQTHFWATGPFSLVYGQNADTARTPGPPGGLDLGYVAIPGNDFVSLVLTVGKSVTPQVVPTAIGSVATFTIKVNSQKYTVDGVTLTDYLPPNWNYVVGTDTTTITRPDKSTLSGAAADPTKTGAGPYILDWSSTQLTGAAAGHMDENQEITLTFTARTTAVLAVGTLSQNRVKAVGTRSFTNPAHTQTFTATDFVYVATGDITLSKTSNATNPVSPGDTFTYTTTVTNPAAAGTNLLTGVSLYDAMPAGLTNVSGTTTLNRSTVADSFATQAYNLNTGSRNWIGNWTEAGDTGGGATNGSAVQGDIQITAGGELSLSNSNSNEMTISRACNLTGATTARLSFRYRTDTGVDAGDQFLVLSGTAGVAGAFPTTVATITGIVGASTNTVSYDISGSISATTAIRLTFPNNSYQNANEFIYIDNLSITYNVPVVGPNPPDLISSSFLYTLVGGQSLTTTYNVTANDPLPTGQTSITNTASVTTAELPIALTASATNTVLVPSALSASSGGRIWLDADGDGLQDIGEPGMPNVEVTLKDRFGTPVATTLTDGNGRYLFTGVSAGTGYYVEVTDGLSAGLSQTFPIPPGLNRTTAFNLSDGQVYTSADLGYRASAGTASFGDQIWVDPNANGVRDSGEIGLGSVTVKLYRDLNGNGILEFTTDLPTGAGTVSATNGSPAVVGTGTAFATVNAGDPITISGVAYTVLSVTDPTHLTLTANYTGTTGGSKAYAMPIATVSNPDGTYLFTGATATGTETYFVSASTPAGYVTTSGSTVYRFINVTTGSTLLTADFGFNSTGTTYSIKDRIWTDTNGDGLFSGESGIAGVSVELLDASLSVIGTTTTASDGSFTFSGLAGGGADYTVRINDTGGVLADYYGTTPYSLALKRAESNLVASIDRVATPPPSYGFRPLRSIGDTIFNDLGGTNGVQDAGEPGMAGVVVSLYRDNDNDGVIDVGEPLVGSVTTDASGQYLFSGLADANYIVSVPIPAGYNFIVNGAVNPDTDGAAAGIQNRAAMVGGVNVLTKDFGFRALVSRIVSGTIWDDLDADGVIDAGENGFPNILVELYADSDGDGVIDAGEPLVGSLTTPASGAYSFPGMASGRYIVKLTDLNSVLTGYNPSFEYGVGTGGPFNNLASVDLTSGSVGNANFGFNKPIPTLVTLSGFRSYHQDGQVAVEWTTASQNNTAGFYLFRLDEKTGKYWQLNRTIRPALPGTRGGTYSLIDKGAALTKGNTYALLEIEHRGKQYAYGPFTVPAGGGNALQNSYRIIKSDLLKALTAGVSVTDEASGYTMKAHESTPKTRARLAATKAAKAKGFSLKKMRKSDQIKISVIKDGLYYIDASEIAALLGMPRTMVIHAIKHTKLALSNQGALTAYMPSDDYSGLFFYGQGIDSVYTKENIYWLYRGKGALMAQEEGSGPVPSDKETFTETVHAEEALYYLTTPDLDPESDYWFWSYHFVAPSYTDYAANTFTIKTYGVADVPATATLTVHIKGFTDTAADPDHHVRVSLMDGTVTKATADGWLEGTNFETPVVMEFDQGLLNNGNNTIKVEAISDPGVPYSAFFVDSFDLTYQRLYEAHDNTLDFKAESAQPVTVYGFTSPSILVLDLIDPQNPVMDQATTIQDDVGSFSVSFVPASPGRRYLVITSDMAATGLTTWRNAPSNLGSKRNMADYLIITTDELIPAAQGLVTYRKGQGYQTMVVNLENIMDEFNYGIYSPWAIKDFLTYAHYNWAKPPKYVLLVGEGTYDYKDNKGKGDNLVPTMIVKTPDGLFASDNILADADGDHLPDVAIGRLPVLTAEELKTLISKIITYESTSAKKVLMISDNADPGGNFPAVSHDIAQLVPARYYVENISLADYSVGDIRNKLLSGISANTFLLNYIGHANPFMLADEGLLFTTDISSMQNPGRLFVMSGMTCLMGDFAIPGFDSVSEELLMKGNSGAAAVWAPSALALNDQSKTLDEGFFAAAFSGRSVTLGNSINKAFRYYKSKGMPEYILDIYNLLGDPALRFPVK